MNNPRDPDPQAPAMDNPIHVSAADDPIHEAAAEWFVRLRQRDLPLETSLQWQQWIGADARHAKAFARIEEVWEESWEMLDRPGVRPRRTARLAMAAAMVAAVGIGAWMVGMDGPYTWRYPAGEAIRTAVGENHEVRLNDGSRVMLGGGTVLNARLDNKTRHIRLVQGEAFFVVARDSARPFVVQSGDAIVTAVGTEFNVRRTLERTMVAVIDGRVTVAAASLPRPLAWLNTDTPVQLDAGEQATVGSNGVKTAARLADPTTATAWQSGQLAFREEPLRYVIEDVNRYAPKPIVIDAAAAQDIGALRVTGTVLGDSVSGWIESLENAFGLRAREEPDRIVLTRRSP